MKFGLRIATTSDFPRVDALYARSYPRLLKADYSPSLLVSAVPLISKARPELVGSGTFYLVETAGGDLIGAGGWCKIGPMNEARVGTVHIRHFATDPNVVRQGVGRLIMERCLGDALVSGAAHVCCYSTITAVPFYEACGFSQVGKMSIELKPAIRFPVTWMERYLP